MKDASDLLTPESGKLCREALVDKHTFAYHRTPPSCLQSIRAGGLQPRDKDPATDVPTARLEMFADGTPKILCLQIRRSIPLNFPWAELAISPRDLDGMVTFDWSHGFGWGLASDFIAGGETVEEAFIGTVKSHDTLAVYKTVRAEHLRVRLKGSDGDRPEIWPCLTDLQDEDEVYWEYGGQTGSTSIAAILSSPSNWEPCRNGTDRGPGPQYVQ